MLRECNIGTPFSESVQDYARKYNIEVDRVENINNKDNENYIKLEIISVVSRNRAYGKRHAKLVNIEATVFENGVVVHKINRTRKSNGGAFGFMKSSCTVLERTVNTLGIDVAKFLNKYLRSRGKKPAI